MSARERESGMLNEGLCDDSFPKKKTTTNREVRMPGSVSASVRGKVVLYNTGVGRVHDRSMGRLPTCGRRRGCYGASQTCNIIDQTALKFAAFSCEDGAKLLLVAR